MPEIEDDRYFAEAEPESEPQAKESTDGPKLLQTHMSWYLPKIVVCLYVDGEYDTEFRELATLEIELFEAKLKTTAENATKLCVRRPPRTFRSRRNADNTTWGVAGRSSCTRCS